MKNVTLHFFGDSHLRTVRSAFEAGLFAGVPCRFELVGGATAVGLRHPTSKTQALKVYRDSLLPYRPNIIPVFQLGEVDCGFVIWVRAQRHGESVRQQLEESLAAYLAFLIEIRDAGYRDLLVTSATLPTILDGQLDGEVAHLRREVLATLRERTDLTLDYNAELARLCHANDLRFLDLTTDFIDPATRVLHDRFRHFDQADHHLHPQRGGEVWAKRVLEALDLR
jgi:hypothetical protein